MPPRTRKTTPGRQPQDRQPKQSAQPEPPKPEYSDEELQVAASIEDAEFVRSQNAYLTQRVLFLRAQINKLSARVVELEAQASKK